MNGDLARGHLDLLLLGILAHGPAHGYAVIAALRERTDGALELAEGSVYPALHRLEDLGLTTSEWTPVSGRRRRLYRITPAGTKALRQERRDWQALTAAVEAVLAPRTARTALAR